MQQITRYFLTSGKTLCYPGLLYCRMRLCTKWYRLHTRSTARPHICVNVGSCSYPSINETVGQALGGKVEHVLHENALVGDKVMTSFTCDMLILCGGNSLPLLLSLGRTQGRRGGHPPLRGATRGTRASPLPVPRGGGRRPGVSPW